MFSTCLHPSKITVNGTIMFVPCGHCIACEHKRAQQMAHRLQDECDYSAATLFCTLSYDNVHLPTYTLSHENSFFYSNRKSLNNFNSYDYSSLPASHIKVPQITNYNFASKNTFGVVCKSDVQKFLKRLRRMLQYDKEGVLENVSQESRRFRYFVCAEYGPRTLRPHYHALLFFSNKLVARAVNEYYFYKAWKLCNQRNAISEFVIGGAAKYVSAYVNINIKLPYLLRLPETRTFVLSSKKPAIGSRLISPTDFFDSYKERDFFTYKSFTDKNGNLSHVKVPFGSVIFKRYAAEPCLVSRFDYNSFLQVLNRFYSKLKPLVHESDFDCILKYVNDYVPNLCTRVNTAFKLYDFVDVYDTQQRYVKLNDLPESIDSNSSLYWLGLYANRFLVTKALAFCFSVGILPFDYVAMHRDIHAHIASESIHSFADTCNDITFDNTYDALQYVALCYPSFVSALPRVYCQMSCEEENTYNRILASFLIEVSDFYDDYGTLLPQYDDDVISKLHNAMPHNQQFINDLYSRSMLDKHNRIINDLHYNDICNF